jgi:hypothetical protein
MSPPKETDRLKSVRGNAFGTPSTNGQGPGDTALQGLWVPDVASLSLLEAVS